MNKFILFTLKTTVRDRLFLLISSLILIYAFVPVFSYFSMRQLQETSITMSISLNSFILLILAIFGGTYTIWSDIERRYTFTLLDLPVKRSSYLLGRFVGFAIIMLFITTINFILGLISIKISAGFYKSELPVIWMNIFYAYYFSFLKYVILLGVGFLITSFSTSFFTPVFSTIVIFIAGNSIQGVYDYVLKAGDKMTPFAKFVIKIIYFILPNFSAFDFTAFAAYALKISTSSVTTSLLYFALYLSILMSAAVLIFNKRDLT